MATYYQGSGGNDGNDGLSWANRFATVQKLVDTVTSADEGRLEGETISATVDLDINTGALTTPIRLFGCDSSGNKLTGANRATITTASTLANGLFNVGSGIGHIQFHRIDFNGGGVGKAEYCVLFDLGADTNGLAWYDCEIHNANSHGTYGRGDDTIFNAHRYVNCNIYGNGQGGTGSGVSFNTSARAGVRMISCKVYDNAGDGAYCAGVGDVLSCAFYANSGCGVNIAAAGTYIIKNNVFFNNTSDGACIANTTAYTTILNNIARSNGGYGFNFNGIDTDTIMYMDYNCAHNNTSGAIDVFSGALPGDNNVTSDPLFISETAGSEDFNLQATSPCKNVGLGY